MTASKVTPAAPAGSDKAAVNVKVVVPLLPSASVTSPTESAGSAGATGPHGLTAVPALRGAGGAAVKSAALLSVSAQPEPLRRAAVVFVSVGAAAPS